MTYEETEKCLADSMGIPYEINQEKINGHVINYIVAGKGPPLLLIHGGNIGWGQWYPNIAVLAENYSVYGLDLPGAGRSSLIDYSTLDLNSDFIETTEMFISTIIGAVPVVLIGSSLGGWISLKLAIRKVVNANKIVIINSLGFTNQIRMADRIIGIYPFAKFLTKTALRPVRNNANIEKFLRGVFLDKDQYVSNEFIEYFYRTMARSHNMLLISSLSSIKGMRPEFILEDDLQNIESESLIIWGRHDPMLPVDWCQKNFTKIPNVKLTFVEKAAHLPSLEQPNEVNSAIRTFLSK